MSDATKTILYPVKDIAKAKARFAQLLGVEPYVDQPYYVAFNNEGQDIGLDPGGHGRGMTGSTVFWHVDDIRSSRQALLDAGGETVEDVKDVGQGNLTAIVKDPDGNVIGLFQAA